LESITISNGATTSIGDWAFAECSALNTVTILGGTKSIGMYAFYMCYSLTSVSIERNATEDNTTGSNVMLKEYAFSLSGTVASITYTGTKEEWEDIIKAENWNSSISDYVVHCSDGDLNGDADLQYTNFSWGLNEAKTGYILWNYTGNQTNVIIPATRHGLPVTEIGAMTFFNYSELKSVTIPNSVTTIGECAFYMRSNLESVTFGSNVTSIGNQAFYFCSSLKSVELPDTVKSIGNQAFYECQSLESVNIPNGVTSIGDSMFYRCESLKSINLPDSVTRIEDNAFYECRNLTSATLGNNVTTIGAWAFYYCSSLTSIKIPSSVTSIGINAFSDCSSLANVEFGNTSGWWYTSNGSDTSGTSIPTSDLTDPSTAAWNLAYTYCNYYLKRN
jgi:hypothetical protein